MGEDKAFLRIDGQLLIERVLEAVGAVVDEIIVVTNRPEKYVGFSVRLVRDVLPDTGPLGGIYTGLRMAERPRNLVVACDMPFLNVDLLRYMAGQAWRYDAVIPYLGENAPSMGAQTTAKARDMHPLHAIYSKRCVGPIERSIERGDLRTIAFLPDVNVGFVDRQAIDRFDPDHLSFFNANTPEELAHARELSKAH